MSYAVRTAMVVASLSAALAQPPAALLGNDDAARLFDRAVLLMESSAVAIPELNRAGAPIVESARQSLKLLRERGGNLPATYSLLTNVRAYVLLADSVPKPFPFPEQAARQFAELRESLARIEAHFAALLADRESALWNSDRDNLKRYAEENAKLPPPQPGKPRVVFFGDSITDFWRLNQYFPDHDFVNRGISGQITGEMLGRFKADVIDLRPEAALILAGTNDLARGVQILAIENNFSMMADLCDKRRVKLILASVLPVNDYHKDENPLFLRTAARPPQLIRALNDWLKSLCEQRGYRYLDYYSAMVDERGMLQKDFTDDGLHPNAAGYRAMAPLALEAIQRIAGASTQQKTSRRRLSKKES